MDAQEELLIQIYESSESLLEVLQLPGWLIDIRSYIFSKDYLCLESSDSGLHLNVFFNGSIDELSHLCVCLDELNFVFILSLDKANISKLGIRDQVWVRWWCTHYGGVEDIF